MVICSDHVRLSKLFKLLGSIFKTYRSLKGLEDSFLVSVYINMRIHVTKYVYIYIYTVYIVHWLVSRDPIWRLSTALEETLAEALLHISIHLKTLPMALTRSQGNNRYLF